MPTTRILFVCRYLLLLSLVSSLAEAAVARTFVRDSFNLALDGAPLGIVPGVAGGDAFFAVGAPFDRPQVLSAPLSWNDLEVEIPFPLDTPLQNLLSEFLSGSPRGHQLASFTEQDRNSRTTVRQVRVKQVQFKSLMRTPTVTFVFEVTGSSQTNGSQPRTASTRRTKPATFALELPDLDSQFVANIDDFTLIVEGGKASLAAPLSVETSTRATTAFQASFEAGASGNRQLQFKTGHLKLLSANLRDVLLDLTLSDVAVISSGAPVDSGESTRTRFSLAIGSLTLTSAETVGTPPPKTATPLPTKTPPAVATPTPAFPVPGKELAAKGADKGLRDISDFPRPEGLVRESYSKNEYTGSSFEEAGYRSTLDTDTVYKSYLKALTAAGWKKESSSESGDSEENHLIMSGWVREKDSVDLRIYGDPKGSRVSVGVKRQN